MNCTAFFSFPCCPCTLIHSSFKRSCPALFYNGRYLLSQNRDPFFAKWPHRRGSNIKCLTMAATREYEGGKNEINRVFCVNKTMSGRFYFFIHIRISKFISSRRGTPVHEREEMHQCTRENVLLGTIYDDKDILKFCLVMAGTTKLGLTTVHTQ